MTRGFDHTSQLAFSHNAAAGRLLGLTEQQIGHAIAMAAVSDASFAVVRAKPLSQWKGLASAQSALGAMNTLFLASRGVEGPLQVVEGSLGIDHLLGMKINIDWERLGYEGVVEKVSVRPNHDYTDLYPRKMPAKITIRLADGKVINHEVQDYPGLASHPFTWEDSVEKFDRLVDGRVDIGLSLEIKDAVRSLENIQVRDLTKLLSSVKAESMSAAAQTQHRSVRG
jgi:2-methylcitrate dehydratase PrpD